MKSLIVVLSIALLVSVDLNCLQKRIIVQNYQTQQATIAAYKSSADVRFQIADALADVISCELKDGTHITSQTLVRCWDASAPKLDAAKAKLEIE